MTEADAIRTRYARRSPRIDPALPYILEERNEAVAHWIARSNLDVEHAKVLDVGCGYGLVLKHLLNIGFKPENLAGIDLIPERARTAEAQLPTGVRIWCGDAVAADLRDELFDVVLLFTVLSSVLGDRRALAKRAWELTRPGGCVLCYDFRVDNPFNPDVRGLPIRELRSLFPQASVSYQRLTVAPPLARVLARLYPVLSRLRFLRTHALTCCRKPGA